MNSVNGERESSALAIVETIGCDLLPGQRLTVQVLAYALLMLDEAPRRALAEAIEGRLAECRAARGGTHV